MSARENQRKPDSRVRARMTCLFAMSLLTRKEHWVKKYRAHYRLLYSGLSTPMQWVSCDIQVYDTILSKHSDKR
jgi:hypothetical protein